MSRSLPLSEEAALVVALAATALPFAPDRRGEVERWLRLLGDHGRSARLLAEQGLTATSTAPPTRSGGPGAPPSSAAATQTVEVVCALAQRHAVQRAGRVVTTADLLAGVADHYGPAFDAVLDAATLTRAQFMGRLYAALWDGDEEAQRRAEGTGEPPRHR